MSDNFTQTIGAPGERKPETKIDLRPTLFIGIGGTGMEVLMRVRRRILNNLWGSADNRVRVESLAEFPVAQFIHFDLDSNSIVEKSRAQADDLQFDQVKFTEEERIVEAFDMNKYSRDDDALEKYPLIKEWLPLTPKRIQNLGIDPGKGAGQIRSVSRLFFFDRFTKVQNKIRQKLALLKAGLSHGKPMGHLGLRMETGRFRIVVVGSVAGGTGSGAFLDMGLLARSLASNVVPKTDVELMLFLPTGYANRNKERTEANGYSALMELESAMKGNKGYVGRWDAYEDHELPREPYDEVYLIDSGNLAEQNTKDINDVYHMVSDVLFEDFASGDFARNKRSVAVNQAQHKNYPHDALVPRHRFPDMRLSYSKRYSAFGQAVLDTRQEARRDARAHRWAGEMLKAFFGVGGSDVGANRATDKHRDEFMANHMGLRVLPFSDFPVFSDRNIELKRSSGEFNDYLIVDTLLQDRHGLLLAGIEQRVNNRVDAIRNGFDRKEWATQVREAMRELERDAVRDQDSTADVTEDRVSKRRREEGENIKTTVREQLYAYLDNKEHGGLEYVLSLVEQIKDRLEATGTGIVAALGVNGERYREIKEAVRTREFERLLNNLEQTKGGFFGSGEKQAALVMDHLRTEMANSLKFHLRAKAADEAAVLMGDLSNWLGRRTGVDAQGRVLWNGLVGEFQQGREGVMAMLAELQHLNAVLQTQLREEHVTTIALPVAEKPLAMPGAAQLRDWADEAFKDIGGSKTLFPMLADSERRAELLAKVKRMAERQLLAVTADGATADADPLVEALDQMSSTERIECFRKLLACAMPWIDAHMGGDFAVNPDQFKCFIGVAGSDEFRRRYGPEINAAVPSHANITPAQVEIVETGAPGRAVAYCELSGVPLTVLRGMEGWRTSYRREEGNEQKSPTHTHIDSTQFGHPIAPSTGEINRLADDFKHFLLAVMLGVLTRSSQRFVPNGQYQFSVARGEIRRIGNERAFRQNGLPVAYRDSIVSRVQDILADLDGVQLAALHGLCRYYETEVYAPILLTGSDGIQLPRKGFASAIAAEAKQDVAERARRKGISAEEIERIGERMFDRVPAWTEAVPDSDEDAYEWEVREPGEDGKPRLKMVVQPAMLEPGRLDVLAGVAPAASPAPAVAFGAAPVMAGAMPPPLGAVPGMMPPPLVEHQYHVGVNGQQFGPYTMQQLAQLLQSGQLAPAAAKVWRQGLPSWVEMTQLAELAPLFAAAAPSMPPPLV